MGVSILTRFRVSASDVDITGAGQAFTIVDGNRSDRVLDVDPTAAGIAANVSALTVANGSATAGGGGAIRNQSSLTISNSTIRDSEALSPDALGGGIRSDVSGTALVIVDTTIRDNIAGPGGFGGGILAANLMLTGSTVSGNNGGPTFTRSLLPGSPAIDAGNPRSSR